ncbi:hypothetical protein J4416_03635 [Candidatus Pacearchaeota archaeon]|nr:hypothetical protein [Candidatus Pacearchaeota archaeon]
MRKEDIGLLNQLLIDMHKLADELEKSLTNKDFESVLGIKRQITILQKRIRGIV